jgi:hypothetical protein
MFRANFCPKHASSWCSVLLYLQWWCTVTHKSSLLHTYFCAGAQFLLCLIFFYNLIDLPSDLYRSYHSGQFWSSCCTCLLETCWSAYAITLLFPASYNTLPSPDSLSPSSIHNIKSSLKHYVEKGHLKLLIFHFYVNALTFLSSLRSSSYTSSRRNRNLSCEKVSNMDI